MTDRELLEAAAKAAGYRYRISREWHDTDHFYIKDDERRAFEQSWNPLESDGDALRLAVKLRIDLEMSIAYSGVFHAEWWDEDSQSYDYVEEPGEPDPCAAMRRAIVRAAAALREIDTPASGGMPE